MTNLSSSIFFSSSCITAFIFLQLLWSCSLFANGCYTSIISFGDSLADTGNLKQLSAYKPDQEPLHFFLPPYGESFFHVPTGRCSNGRLVIDFIAESIRLPLVRPFVGGNRNRMTEFRQGVNYAVVGATALDSSFHAARGVHNPLTNSSLRVQLGWFKQSWPSICMNVQDCNDIISHSLILMGEIGGNDYNHALLAGKSIDVVETYVPLVVKAIVSTIKELIKLGARTLLVPGNLPIGCSAAYLTMYYGSDKGEYDNSTGCLIRLNKLSEYHNELLHNELYKLRELHRDANIIYADYYNAAMQFFRHPNKFGFTNGALKACCGGVGPFNYNSSVPCADPSSTLCTHPDTYVNWDGLHLTQAAYKVIYKSLFHGPYTVPQFNSICPTSMLQIKELSNSSK